MKKNVIVLFCIISLGVQAQVANIKDEAQRFMEILYYIDMMYVDSSNTNELTTSAIVKMLGELDPHSQYIVADEVEAMSEQMNGEFEGVGISYNIISDTLVVIQAIPGGPSETVGIFPGDRIVSVDGKNISGKDAKRSDIQKFLRGKKGTKVIVEVVRRGVKDKVRFEIVRDVIPLHSVDASYMIQPGIGYIKLSSFSRTTIDEMATALGELKGAGMTHLILDLQSNGGGMLHASIDLVDQFLGTGKLIVYTEGEHQRRVDAKSTDRGVFEEGKVTVLIDEYSASASEITSGAIQDWDRGLVVGRRSYGKGLVQRPIKLSDGGELRLTTARYYTPSGRNIQRPYSEGKESYYKELERRYKHGEFQHADSIDFPDSLQYKTLEKGRTVYGGGGIFPDVFVPLDTTKFSPYYRALISKGIILSITSQYLDKERKSIKRRYPTFSDFDKDYEVSEKLLKELVKAGEESKIKYNEEEYKQSFSVMKTQLKALVARGIYDQESYYRVINETNQILQKALEVIDN